MYLALPYLANTWTPDQDGSDDVYTAHWSASLYDVMIDYGWVPPSGSGRRLSADEESDEGLDLE